MNLPQRTIRPYVNHSLDIKNSYAYRDFLRRRHKKAQQFKFSIPRNQFILTFASEKQIQLKLLKILKVAKPIIKIDLKEFVIARSNFWKAGILSAWKKISHVKTLFMTMMKAEAKSVKRYFKYFPRLELLNYQLNDLSTMFNLFPDLSKDVPANYLQSLKCCPKIHSLRIQDFSKNGNSLKTGFESRRYLRSLDSLALRNECWSGMEPIFPIELCENLKSISIRIFDAFFCQASPQTLNALSKLSHLKEISLCIELSQMFNLDYTLQEIAKRGMLEKVSLEVRGGAQNLYQIFEALTICKLTYFSLRTEIQGDTLKSISDFLKNMSSLESFHLDTSNPNFYITDNDNDYTEICKQINKLQNLRNLKLNLEKDGEISKSPRIKCFIYELSDIFNKPIKMETFHLISNKLPAAESFESLVSVLGTSTAFLTHLRIDIGTLPFTKEIYRSLLPLLKILSRIQALEILCLAVNGSTSQLLIELAKALHGCIYLREFRIGEIKETAVVSDVANALEIILSKRGLRQFDCLISNGFQKKSVKETHIQFPDLKRIIEKNPHLDTTSLGPHLKRLIRNQQCLISL